MLKRLLVSDGDDTSAGLISVANRCCIASDNACSRRQGLGNEPKKPTLEDFVTMNDQQVFQAAHGLAHLADRAQLRLLNSSQSVPELQHSLRALNLTNEERLRPSWDQYFMRLASLAAQRSNCMKRRVGCVLVREKRVISTGYNGTPRNLRNCNEGGCE